MRQTGPGVGIGVARIFSGVHFFLEKVDLFLVATLKTQAKTTKINQSINQYIYNAPWYRGTCYGADYAEAKRNVLSRVLNVLTDGAVRQFRGREFQSLGAATEKQRAAVSKLCGGTDRNFCVDNCSERAVNGEVTDLHISRQPEFWRRKSAHRHISQPGDCFIISRMYL